MGKFLRVLVVIILVLTIGSLTLATLLFMKREILKGRTNKLEKGLEKISLLLEAEPPAVPEEPETYPARDTSECTDELLDNPQTSLFWDSYKQQLEEIDHAFMGLKGRHDDLASYYKVDIIDGKSVTARDSRNMKITEGPGTTQGVIDDVIAHATAQLDLLAETRQQLMDIRIELVDTINELNGRKTTLREKLNTIVDLNNQIVQLNRKISDLENNIEELKEEITGLQENVSVLEQEKRVNLEEIESLNITKEELKGIIVQLRQIVDKISPDGPDGPDGGFGGNVILENIKIAPGHKGLIASVDQDHQFVVIETEQEFITELLNATTKEGYMPLVSLIIKRDGVFVSKVRIKQLKQEDLLLIGEILLDWQQGPIKVGDKVFFQ